MPFVEIARARYLVEENVGMATVVLKRRGDPQTTLNVLCVTESLHMSGKLLLNILPSSLPRRWGGGRGRLALAPPDFFEGTKCGNTVNSQWKLKY